MSTDDDDFFGVDRPFDFGIDIVAVEPADLKGLT